MLSEPMVATRTDRRGADDDAREARQPGMGTPRMNDGNE